MGHKISPISARLGINKTWKSVWFAKKADFAKNVMSDIYLKKALREALNPAGLDSIKIFRFPGKMEIEVNVARPGVAIGRGGEGIDTLQKKLKKMAKMSVEIKIKEVKKPDHLNSINYFEIKIGNTTYKRELI